MRRSERSRITIPVQMLFYVVIFTYVVAMALIGGAGVGSLYAPGRSSDHYRVSLPRYGAGSNGGPQPLHSWRWPSWRRGSGNPPYGFSPEDKSSPTAITSVLHENAEQFLEARLSHGPRVLTAGPRRTNLTAHGLATSAAP